MTQNLGAIVSELQAAQVIDIDWQLAAYGDCTHLVAAGEQRQLEAIARKHGFSTLDDVRDAVEAATTPKWAHFHLSF